MKTENPKANQIDVYSIEARLRKNDKEAWQYIKALKAHDERQKDLLAKALGKIKAQAKSIHELNKENNKLTF